MNFSVRDAEIESARTIIAECIGKVMHALHDAVEKGPPERERIEGLRGILQQLRTERRAVVQGDRAAVQRARLFYGLLLQGSRRQE